MAVSRAPHCALGPDDCWACKVRYWRVNGSPLSLPTHFKAANEGGYTQRELSDDVIREAKASGREIERVR